MRKDLNNILARIREQKNAEIKKYLQNHRLTMYEVVELLEQREEEIYLPSAIA